MYKENAGQNEYHIDIPLETRKKCELSNIMQ